MIRLKLEKDQLFPILVQKYQIFLTNLLKNKGDKLEELAKVCDEPCYIWLTSAEEHSAKKEGQFAIQITNITRQMNGAIKLFNGSVSLVEKNIKTSIITSSDYSKIEESENSVDIFYLASRLANCVLNNTASFEGWSPKTLLTIVDREISRIENTIKAENHEINKVLESFDSVNFALEQNRV